MTSKRFHERSNSSLLSALISVERWALPRSRVGILFVADAQIAQINALLTEADRVKLRKSFGLREDYNPLLYIPADLYLCNAKDVTTPEEGNPGPGRDFKGWTQMALFILGPYLSDGQKEVLLAFSKEFRITYCDFFKPALLDEWKSVAKLFMVKFGPCSSFSAERFASFNSNVRMYNVFGNRLAPSRDIAKRLQHLHHICHGGNASKRCGGALYFTPLLQHMSEVSQQVASQSEVSQQVASQSEQVASQSEVSQQVASQSEVSQQVASQSEVSQQVASQSEVSQQVASQSEVSQQVASQSGSLSSC
ncbi:hypothetical protein EMCRGX_G022732 [Ephydatia muelleri]